MSQRLAHWFIEGGELVRSIKLGRSAAFRSSATLGLAAIIVAGCAAPGPAATPPPTAAPATAAPGESVAPSASAEASIPDCGTDPVTLNIYHETISELMPQ